MHRTPRRVHPSDCDVLAIRPPHVYEDIGGTAQDWDPTLTKMLDFTRFLGVICEVKGGKDIEPETLFVPEWVSYAVARLGLVGREAATDVRDAFAPLPTMQIVDGVQIAKLLVSRSHPKNGQYLSLTLDHLESFIRGRIRKYQEDKHRDRYFFDSILIQQLIFEENRAAVEDKRRIQAAKEQRRIQAARRRDG